MSNHPLTVFLGGIIQGSKAEGAHEQGYRDEIKELLRKALPDCELYDASEQFPVDREYDAEDGRDAFLHIMDRAGEADVLVAYLPEASMGTAVEMWVAFHTGAVILAISPLAGNWTVGALADAVVPDLPAFQAFLEAGKLNELIQSKIGYEVQT